LFPPIVAKHAFVQSTHVFTPPATTLHFSDRHTCPLHVTVFDPAVLLVKLLEMAAIF
jgi:hypothetical protein